MNRDKNKDEMARYILQKTKDNRNLFDVRWLQKELATNSFFKNLSQKDLMSYHLCIKELGYYFARQGEVIVRYGEFGSTFFVIIKGIVDVYVPSMATVQLDQIEYSKLLNEYSHNVLEIDGGKFYLRPQDVFNII